MATSGEGNNLVDPAFFPPKQEGEEEDSLCLPMLLCSSAPTGVGCLDVLWPGENTNAEPVTDVRLLRKKELPAWSTEGTGPFCPLL